MYKISRLEEHDWFDDRLHRCVKGFNLSEKDVFAFKRTFDIIIGQRSTNRIRVIDLFDYIDFPLNQIGHWIVAAVKPASNPNELLFSEYVHLLCFYLMFSSKNLIRFLFQCVDTDNKFYLRREQFNELLRMLAENSPFNVAVWELEYNNYYDKKLKYLFVTNFERFVFKNPGTCLSVHIRLLVYRPTVFFYCLFVK